jgi:hypothetical protein
MWPFKPKPELTATAPKQAAPTPAVAPASLALPDGPLTHSLSPYVEGTGRVMITNGGAHPPELWAQATAQHIAPINPKLSGRRYSAALELQLAIAAALEPHHGNVQTIEKGKLTADPAHLLTDLDPEPHLDDVIKVILAIAKGTEWEAHFARADVQAAIRLEVGVHFATSQHIERSWHVDRNPDHPHAAAWRARHHPGV